MSNGVAFRQAANDGHINLMKSYLSGVDIEEAGSESKMTAAHRAAAKGRAAVLRLLFSLGDSFSKVDNKGNTPEKLAKDLDCKKVFELASLARKALAVVDKIFPHRVDVNKLDELKDKPFLDFRNKRIETRMKLTTEVIMKVSQIIGSECPNKQDLINVINQWLETHGDFLFRYYDPYATLKEAAKAQIKEGACGETSVIVFGYLTYVVKTKLRVEYLLVPHKNTNHAFIIVNRNPDGAFKEGLREALLIDAHAKKVFFYEFFDVANSLIEKEIVQKEYIECSSIIQPIPQTAWPQPQLTEKMKEIYAEIEEMTVKEFEKIQ
jgi:Ankyrin repeats (many copies)